MSELLECWNCSFVETIEETMIENFIEIEDLDGNVYDEEVLECPICGKAQR